MKPYWRQREGVVLRQSARLTADIQRGLVNSFNIPTVVEEFLAAHPVSDNLTPAQARVWARMNIVPNYEALKPVLRLVWATGYVFGRDFAKFQYARATLSKSPSLEELEIAFDTNWDNWTVGNKRSEALVRPPQGLQNLLDAQNITITGIDRTSVDRLGTLLADAVGEGWGADKLSREIKTMLRDPSRALMIARTEMSRASNIASNELWKEYGVAKVEWSEVDGCEYCLANAEAGPIEIGSSFPSGVTEPPAHPNCMCALIPFVDEDDMLGSIIEGDTPATPAPVNQPQSAADNYVNKPDRSELLNDPQWAADLEARINEMEAQNLYRQRGALDAAAAFDSLEYHDKPIVLPKEQIDDLINEGWTETFRGVKGTQNISAQQIHDAFTEGDIHFAGRGLYGHGTYTSTNLKTASEYAGRRKSDGMIGLFEPEPVRRSYHSTEMIIRSENTSYVERFAVNPNAAGIEYSQLDEIISLKKEQLLAAGLDESDVRVRMLDTDRSVIASSLGYDYITVTLNSETYFVVLNRSAVAVEQSAPYKYVKTKKPKKAANG